MILYIFEIGYQKAQEATLPGTYRQRGGVVDVFPVASHAPYRLEFLGDQLTSIRVISLKSKLSQKAQGDLQITPAHDIILEKSLYDNGPCSRRICHCHHYRHIHCY